MRFHEFFESKKLDVPTPTVAELAKKHGVTKDRVERELAKGIKIEMEHTTDPKVAREIALDHLNEKIDYYTKLKQVEEDISLREGVNDHFLYHATRSENVSKIFKSGVLELSEPFEFDVDGPNPETRDTLSTSRDQFYRFGRSPVQFVLDKPALIRGGWEVKPKVGWGHYKAEAEERVYHKQNKPIPLKPPYVVAIQYDDELTDIPKSFFAQAKKMGLKTVPMKPQSKNKAAKPMGKPITDDPSKIEIDSQNFSGDITYSLYLKTSETGGRILQPFYMVKDKEMIQKAYDQIVDRTKKGLGIDDLLSKYTKTVKSWKHGTREVPDLGEAFERYLNSIVENFADGKVKGKSRPGRVKKAGASCKGSVSELRARAKKYGGEKGKMYHWCVNMKGGKK